MNFSNSHELTLQDSVYVLAAAVKELINNETITEAPKACEDTDVIWESGTFSIWHECESVHC